VKVKSNNETEYENNVRVLNELTGCTNIQSSGGYGLSQNVQSTNICYKINASNVILNGMGHAVTANDGTFVNPEHGVSAVGENNVSVKNTVFKDWAGSGDAAIRYKNVTDGSITGVRTQNSNFAVQLQGSEGIVMSNNTIRGNNKSIKTDGFSGAAENLTIDGDGTTVSFEAEDVSVSEANNVSEAPGVSEVNIGRSFNAEDRSNGAFLNVSVSYTDEDVTGVDESTLQLREYDGTSWMDIPSSEVDTQDQTVSANITQFSTFSVQGEEQAVLNLTDAQGIPGENVTVSMKASEQSIAGYQANFTFNETVAQVVNIEPVDTTEWTTTESINNQDGYVSVTGSNDTGVNNPHLLDITYRIDPQANTTSSTGVSLQPEDTTLNDENAPLNTGLNNGSIEVLRPAFVDVNITGTNSPVKEGETLNMTANFTNTGEVSDFQTVYLNRSGGKTEDTDTVFLDGGETVSKTLRWNTDANGTYQINVTSEDDRDTDTVTVLEPADFDVEVLGTNSPVNAAETVNVTTSIENLGEVSDRQNITLDINRSIGETESFSVQLGGGENTTQTLQWGTNINSSGAYGINVSSEDDSSTENVSVSGRSFYDVEIRNTTSPVTATETLNVTADITNLGGVSGDQNVTLSVNNSVGTQDNTTVQLSPGENTTRTLRWDTGVNSSGGYQVSVTTDNDTDTETVTVLEPAEFDVQILSTNAPVNTTENLSVTAEITNLGEVSGEQEISLGLNRSVGERDNLTVQLSEGENTTRTLRWDTPEAGDYEVNVTSHDDSDIKAVTILEEASFNVTILGTNSPVAASKTLNVTAEIDNTGEVLGEQTVSLSVNDSVGTQDNATVRLNGSENTTRVLSWNTSIDTSGGFTVNVSTDDDSDTKTVGVVGQAEFDIRILGTNSPVVEPSLNHSGGTLNVTTNVTNVGGVTDERNISLGIAGVESNVKNTTVQLDSGETKTKVLSWETTEGAENSQTANVSVGSDSETKEFFVCQPGDATSTGSRSPLDATYLLQYIVGEQPGPLPFDADCADSTDDGSVGPSDVTLIQQVIVGLEPSVTPSDAASGDLNGSISLGEVSTENRNLSAGDTVTVEMNAEGESIAGYETVVRYDQEVVRLTGVNGMELGNPTVSIDDRNGTVHLVQAQATGVTDPHLANLTFRVVGNVNGATRLDIVEDETVLNNENPTQLTVSVEDGSIGQTFSEPILGSSLFEGPPQNTQDLHPDLYEDLDGDGDSTDLSQTTAVFGELIRNGQLGLTDRQARALNWNPNSPETEVTAADMVTLFGEQIRAD
jgi:hypothetical protein